MVLKDPKAGSQPTSLTKKLNGDKSQIFSRAIKKKTVENEQCKENWVYCRALECSRTPCMRCRKDKFILAIPSHIWYTIVC
jgi:hypothetical protein